MVVAIRRGVKIIKNKFNKILIVNITVLVNSRIRIICKNMKVL